MAKFVIGRKSGMTQLFDENGNVIPATVIEVEPMYVLQNKTVETDGYKAVKVGSGAIREKLVNKPTKGVFDKAGVSYKRFIREFRFENAAEYQPGQEIKADIFAAGDHVDATATSKGKGFQGVYHRRVGSMGATSTPGRVMPGKKMPGHMGAVNCTVQNLSVVMVDGDRGILVLKGAIPGPKGGLVTVETSVKAK